MDAAETCKIDHVIERWGLTAPGGSAGSVDDHLVERWTGSGDAPAVGYKQLTEWFNKRLLKRAYERNGRDTMRTRIDGEYEALRGEDDIVRREVMDDLRADGIDARSLVDDMVSWSTMRRHLQGCLDAEKAAQEATTEWELRSLDIARSQMASKAVSALKSLATKEELPDAHRADVEVQVKLSCPECPTRVPLEDAVERGYVCSDHFDAVPADDRPGTVGSATKALLPIGLAQTILFDSLYLDSFLLDSIVTEGSLLAADVLSAAPL
jgi:hypothetical protein